MRGHVLLRVAALLLVPSTVRADPPKVECRDHYECAKHDAAWGKEVVASCQRGCDGTNANDCGALANIYASGKCGVAKDEKKAGEVAERSCAIAARGSENCTYAGTFFAAKLDAGGLSSGPDHVRARKAFEHGCEINDYESCKLLGRQLRDGVGGPVDGLRAVELLSKACDERVPEQAESCLEAAKMYEKGTAGVPKNAKEASARRSLHKRIMKSIP